MEFAQRRFQIPKTRWRYSFARCRVTVYQHLDDTITLSYGLAYLRPLRWRGPALSPDKLLMAEPRETGSTAPADPVKIRL